MTLLAWMFLAAIPIAWALTSLSYAIQNRRDEAKWQDALDAAHEDAENARTAARSSERVMHQQTQRALDAELGIGLLHMEVERLGALLAERAAVVPIAKKRGGGKAAGKAVGRS